jgi:uncharacterized membrane protein YbhN (UPF0104 family)
VPLASLGDSLRSLSDGISSFFDSVGAIQPLPLLLGLVFFGLNLTARSRAYFHSLRAAYPAERFKWRHVWAAYMAAVGFNSVIPAHGGDVIKVFLVKTSIPNSSYPTVAAAFLCEAPFDLFAGLVVLIFAFTQGVFPKPPDFSKIPAFDLQFFASNPRFTLFAITVLGVLALVLFALLSRRVRAFWARIRQGVTILFDRRRYLREVAAVQAVGWLCRFAAFWFLLEAFNIGGSFTNVMLVFGVNAVAGFVPFTPGGAGVQQALLVQVFSKAATGATVAAYSVGQQVATAVFTLALGFGALVLIFRITSFKEVIRRGKEDRAAEKAAREGGGEPAPPVGSPG